MPKIERAITHDLGTSEAKRRLNKFLKEAQRTSNLEYDWKEEVLSFKMNVQGINLAGTARVTSSELQLMIRLPLIAVPFSNWITRIMKMALKKEAVEPAVEPNGHQVAEEPAAESNGHPAPLAPANEQPVLLFLHIPKAAGTTLGEYLFSQCNNGFSAGAQDGLYKKGIYYAPFGFFKTEEALVPDYARTYLQDQQLSAVIGHFSFGIHECIPKPTIYYTMLRHPVERILSLYYFLKADKNIPLGEFLSNRAYRELDNDQTRRLAGVDPHFGHCKPEHLDMAKANLRRYFITVGLAGRFDESVLLLKNLMGWEQDFVYYPRNVTKDRPRAGEIAREDHQMILDMNALDLQLYEEANRLLDEKIKQQGPAFSRQLAAYRESLPAQKMNN